MSLPNAGLAPAVSVNAEIQREQALELRMSGATYHKIAKALSIGVSTAHRYVTEGLAELREQNLRRTEEVRDMDVARLDAMLLKLWNDRAKPRVADTILRILERRARLLGLDAPTRWEGSGPLGGPIPIASASIDLSQLSTADLELLERILRLAIPPASPPIPAALPDAPTVEADASPAQPVPERSAP